MTTDLADAAQGADSRPGQSYPSSARSAGAQPRKSSDGSVPPQPERQATGSKKEVKDPSSVWHCGLG